jgi:hypothetical protein
VAIRRTVGYLQEFGSMHNIPIGTVNVGLFIESGISTSNVHAKKQKGVTAMDCRRYSATAFFLFAFAVVCQCSNAQDCSAILEHGIFDKTTTDSLRIRTQTLINWLSQSTFKSFAEARDAGGKIGFPIDGIPIELSGYSRDNEWSQYQASLQTLDISDTRVLQDFHQTLEAADHAIVNAWQVCILNNKGIAHSVVEMNDDPKKFTLLLLYDAVGEPYKAKILDFSIAPDTAVCEPAIATHWYWHDNIPSGGRILNCNRQTAADAIQVTGNTDKGPLSAKLPGIVPAIAPPEKAWHTEDKNGQAYVEFWTMDPNCTGHPERVNAKHRCQFQQTQIHEPGDNTAYDTWNLYMDARGPVYEVTCVTTGQHEIKPKGVPQGNTGLCTGEINGGDSDIRMSVKWKERW